MQFLAKPLGRRIQPDWFLQFVTMAETMGSLVFTWEPFKVANGARLITILNLLCIDKVKKKHDRVESSCDIFAHDEFSLSPLQNDNDVF